MLPIGMPEGVAGLRSGATEIHLIRRRAICLMADKGWQCKFEGPIFDHPHLFPKVGDFT
jgi:hypothetical protein